MDKWELPNFSYALWSARRVIHTARTFLFLENVVKYNIVFILKALKEMF